MRTIREIENDYHVACMTKSRQKQFYKDCSLLLEKQYDEQYFLEELKKCKDNIRILLWRRKSTLQVNGFDYKQELKNQRRYLKTLKYLLNATRSFRRRKSTKIATDEKGSCHKEKISNYPGVAKQ